jgi:hypothetical protein
MELDDLSMDVSDSEESHAEAAAADSAEAAADFAAAHEFMPVAQEDNQTEGKAQKEEEEEENAAGFASHPPDAAVHLSLQPELPLPAAGPDALLQLQQAFHSVPDVPLKSEMQHSIPDSQTMWPQEASSEQAEDSKENQTKQRRGSTRVSSSSHCSHWDAAACLFCSCTHFLLLPFLLPFSFSPL